MELIYTNDLCTGCNKCVRGCPVLTANIATQEGYVTVDPDKCIACGECFDVLIGSRWVPTRIEMDDRWYLVGVKTDQLAGLRVRM